MRALVLAAVLIGGGALGVAGPGLGAAPANLVSNGTFHTSVTPWTNAEWNVADAGGSPSSGSARVTNRYEVDYDAWAYGEQCIDGIVPGGRYTLSVQVMVPSGQPRLLGVGITTQDFFEPGCTGEGGPAGTRNFADLGVRDAWESLSLTTTYLPMARSVLVYLMVGKHGATGTTSPPEDVWARFDNIVFVPATLGAFRLVVPAVARQ